MRRARKKPSKISSPFSAPRLSLNTREFLWRFAFRTKSLKKNPIAFFLAERDWEGQKRREMASSVCCRPVIMAKSFDGRGFASTRILPIGSGFSPPRVSSTDSRLLNSRICGVRASMVDSYGSSDFVKRMEQAWEISQQPTPIGCSSCNSNGHVECKWCAGTGFFILGDNMLCQVPSRNTTCVICAGKGSMRCSDCKGTGYRARWLGEPPISK